MIVKRPQLDQALRVPAQTRCFLFYGPDEAGSRALLGRLVDAVGNAERVALTGADLKTDPARLADEAASLSMFGDARLIVVDPAGDEATDAVSALLGAPVAGNAVALIAGALKPTSKLVKLVLTSPGAIGVSSYLPEGRDAERLAADIGRELGLTLTPDVARRIADAAGGNRGIIARELEKLALYVAAEPGAATGLSHEAVDALVAGREEGDLSALVDRVFDGDRQGVERELARLRSDGVEGITLLRAAARRALLLARLRAQVERGASPSSVMASVGKSIFWKEKDGVGRQIARWPADRLGRAVSRIADAESRVKQADTLGPLFADAELLEIAREAERRRG